MQKSLIQGLNEKDMQAVVNTYQLNDVIYPSVFPLQFNPTLSWKSLEGNEGIPVMADVVAFDASNPLKKREPIGKIQGDIPKISMQFDMKESEINTYDELRYYAGQGNSSANMRLLDFVYGDMEKCWKGVNRRLEWLAFKAASEGKFKLTSANNNGKVTEYDVDFLVPTDQKTGISTENRRWTVANKTTALPIDDIRAWRDTMKAKGKIVRYIFMNDVTFEELVQIEQMQTYAASFAVAAMSLQRRPNLATVNEVLRAEGLPEIRIVETYVTIETAKGDRSSENPWKTGNIVLSPTEQLGNTFHGPSAYESRKPEQMMQVKRGHVLIQKWSQPSPLVESTAGVANAIPVLGQAFNIYMVNTISASF